jgi:hypothetical protein
LNDKVLAEFKRINCTCSFIPGSTTGFIQVCNVGINKVLKKCISDLADLHYDAHEQQWIENKYTVEQRRTMLVNWVAQAWEDLHKYDSDLICQTFTDLGLTLPTNGTEDYKIKIKDLPGITVGDWKSWKPTKACVQPLDKAPGSATVRPMTWIETIMANKTTDEIEASVEDREEEALAESDSDDSQIEE